MHAKFSPLAQWIVLCWILTASNCFATYLFTTVDDPSGLGGSVATGVSGTATVGYYTDRYGNNHGFLFDGKHFAIIDDPNASDTTADPTGAYGTEALGISGTNIVGVYVDTSGSDHGFLRAGTTYSTVDDPHGMGTTFATGVSGTDVVGYYTDSNGDYHGFLLSGATYTRLDAPQSSDSAVDSSGYDGTLALGISGTDIVGYYVDDNGNDHGFLLSGTTYSKLDDPDAAAGTFAAGCSGGAVAGYYIDSNSELNGFVLSGTTYTKVDAPAGVNGTQIMGISNGAVVGDYQDVFGNYNGFYAEAPSVIDVGKFTLLISATDTSASIPQGIGYATLVASGKGAITMSGRLPDGESFSLTGTLVPGINESHFTINKSLAYSSVTVPHTKGALTGTLTFESSAGSDLDGTLTWTKPEQSEGPYQAPINTNLSVIGSYYLTPTVRIPVLPGFTTGTLELSDTGALSTSGGHQIDKSVMLGLNNQLIVTNAGSDRLKVTITPSTGAFKGSFYYPDNSKVSFRGVVFQDQTMGAGFFLGPDGSGTVNLRTP